MKNLFKKNQMIVTALAVLIAVAGYLKYTYENPQSIQNAKQADNQVRKGHFTGIQG